MDMSGIYLADMALVVFLGIIIEHTFLTFKHTGMIKKKNIGTF